ncbi:MAG: sigma 54-interacting transcriptional regulator [Bacteroidota bacterium]
MSKTDTQEYTTFLSGVSFFSEVSELALAHLCENMKIRTFRKGEVIFHKGDEGDAMFVILEGKIRVHEQDHMFGLLEAGECFGEYALIDNKDRSASVTALERTKVLELKRSHFMHLMKTDNGFSQGVLSVMIRRHRELDAIQERLAVSKQAIELANEKLNGLINGAMDAIIMFNSDFRIVLTNPSANELLQNDDPLQRNLLFFFDDTSAVLLEKLVKEVPENLNNYLPQVVKVIGSDGMETLNEGTISKYGSGSNTFYTLILRNIEERLKAEDTISLLTTQTNYLEEEIKELTSSYGILAEDPAMQKVLELISQVANTDATVLITGETGTGKELVARAIHSASSRNDKPLIRVNCGAIPANLIESELFGHEKGAFTGATASRKGRFLLADKGTLFLDEIGELPLELQPKLLRVIQEGEFDPLGSSETIKVDVRIIAATHRDLLAFSKEGKFREDLFYRLNVFPLDVPALRERGNDVQLIAEEMIRLFSAKLNKKPITLSHSDKELIASYHWPGNVRELQNLVERAVIVSQNGKIDWTAILPINQENTSSKSDERNQRVFSSEEMIQMEKENMLRALKKTSWKISGVNGAAQLLGIAPTTFTSRMKSLGISRPI